MSDNKVTSYAVEVVPPDAYLETEWREARQRGIGASEIAAVLGLSPWVSRFDLWWTKRTGCDSQPENRAMRRGHRYEALILQDFAEEHPEFRLASAGLCASVERPWQLCTPDALAFESGVLPPNIRLLAAAGQDPVAVVQAKSGANRSEWGEPGTDEIPVHYRAQVLWEMDTLGLNVAYVPVVFGFDYREYVVTYDEADVMLMREAAERFLADVEADRQPDVDGHLATSRRLRHLHPKLTDREVEVPATIVRQYQLAARLEKAAQARKRLAENRVRALLGDASTAVVLGAEGGVQRFAHTIRDMPERTQTVSAHRRDQINFPRKELSK